ncbi:FAD-dependent monooxygenase family protein [Aliterella atlantica]|uniref:hypothetical protein n=1 Tax=Aliterella atlantica TaxID=1827278 RepID=UPI001185C8FA|nr:hypothetical protein [Aliterella atlantica]
MHGGVFHQSGGKTRVTSRKKPMLTFARTKLVITLLQKLTEKYDNSRLNLHFNHACTKVDFTTKTIGFQTPAQTSAPPEMNLTTTYDLLIGADGARSAVRKAFLNTEMFEFEQKYVPTDYKSFNLPCPTQQSKIHLHSDKIHSWRSDGNIVVLLVPQLDGSLSGTITLAIIESAFLRLEPPKTLHFFLRISIADLITVAIVFYSVQKFFQHLQKSLCFFQVRHM